MFKSVKALEDGEQSEEVENFTLLNADGSVEAVLDEKMDNLLITSEAKVLPEFDSEFGLNLISNLCIMTIQDDYFPDATGDAPQGNRLGGGAIDMSGSGAWARNDLDDMVTAPSRPASLSISNSTSTNTASTIKVWVFQGSFSVR